MVRLHLKGINTARKRLADGSLKKYYYHRGTGVRMLKLRRLPVTLCSTLKPY